MLESELSDLTQALHNEKPYLSDVIQFSTDIAPHPFVCIWSGVGSGKNTLIENFAKGIQETNIPKPVILLISSRKSKVIETLNNNSLDFSNKFTNYTNLNDIYSNEDLSPDHYTYFLTPNDPFSTVIQLSLVCTNAAIETYHKYRFDPSDPVTHLWNRFDMIVWDEAHSITTDSSYQSAPYHVMRLFHETYRRMMQSENPPRCKHLILMTGTPEPLSSISMPKSTHLLDFRKICKNVFPKNIYFLNNTQVQRQIQMHSQTGERAVYFGNHVPFPNDLSIQFGIPQNKIAVSFSDEERRLKLKQESESQHVDSSGSENDYERMVNVEKHLYNHDSIRSDITFFYTTSRNKEGININDPDIHHVYIESHNLTDIKQMAGRLRNGVENVYIILDSKGHGNSEPRFEQIFAQEFCNSNSYNPDSSHVNTMLNAFCTKQKLTLSEAYHSENSEVGEFIDFIKKKSPYLEYDYFAQEIRYNFYRQKARAFAFKVNDTFNDAAKHPKKLAALFQKEFPYSFIHTPLSPIDEGREYVENYLKQHPERDHPYSEIIEIAEYLKKLLGTPKRSSKNTDENIAPNYYLHKVGFHSKRRNNNVSHPNYSFCILQPYIRSIAA